MNDNILRNIQTYLPNFYHLNYLVSVFGDQIDFEYVIKNWYDYDHIYNYISIADVLSCKFLVGDKLIFVFNYIKNETISLYTITKYYNAIVDHIPSLFNHKQEIVNYIMKYNTSSKHAETHRFIYAILKKYYTTFDNAKFKYLFKLLNINLNIIFKVIELYLKPTYVVGFDRFSDRCEVDICFNNFICRIIDIFDITKSMLSQELLYNIIKCDLISMKNRIHKKDSLCMSSIKDQTMGSIKDRTIDEYIKSNSGCCWIVDIFKIEKSDIINKQFNIVCDIFLGSHIHDEFVIEFFDNYDITINDFTKEQIYNMITTLWYHYQERHYMGSFECDDNIFTVISQLGGMKVLLDFI